MSQIITSKFLRKSGVDRAAVKFFENNFPLSLFPEGLDLTNIKITGDYFNIFEIFTNLLECKCEYNSDENISKKILLNGTIYEYDNFVNLVKITYVDGKSDSYSYEYDSEGRLITKILHYTHDSSYIWRYNDKGNVIEKIYPSGYIKKWNYEYDHNDNVIKEISEDYINEYKYDDRNNLIEKKFYGYGDIITFIFKYDLLGRLIQADECFIKYLD